MKYLNTALESAQSSLAYLKDAVVERPYATALTFSFAAGGLYASAGVALTVARFFVGALGSSVFATAAAASLKYSSDHNFVERAGVALGLTDAKESRMTSRIQSDLKESKESDKLTQEAVELGLTTAASRTRGARARARAAAK